MQARYPFAFDYADETLDPLIQSLVVESEDDVGGAQFGDLRDRAIVALTVHKVLLQLKSQSGSQGPAQLLSAYAADSVSGTFVTAPPENIAATSLHFYTTQAGVDYMELCSRVGSGMRLV